jgi:bifunctional non-homologous end joining protein LigD
MAARSTNHADPLPRYAPQLAQLVKTPPGGDAWVHEIKYDGYRIGCRIERAVVTLLSRNGKDWTRAFPEIVAAAKALHLRSALFDGEVCFVGRDGRTSFQDLQNLSSAHARRALVYFVFDLLYLNGRRLIAKPLEARKRVLEALLRGRRLQFAGRLDADGAAAFREACRLGLEGIVSKRRDQPYQSGKRIGWLKTKCVQRQEFVIGGFTDPTGAREGIGALLIGHYEGDDLVFAGKVGTGFTVKAARELRAALNRLEVRASPFTPSPAGGLGRNAHWTRPVLVCEIVFTEWTTEGKIRHPSFQGLRTDKDARTVIRERPARPSTRRA